MIRTIRTCDKCGEEMTTPGQIEQFWAVGVQIRNLDPMGSRGWSSPIDGLSLEVCRPCLKSFGILAKKDADPPPPPPEETIGDLVRRILEMAEEGAA